MEKIQCWIQPKLAIGVGYKDKPRATPQGALDFYQRYYIIDAGEFDAQVVHDACYWKSLAEKVTKERDELKELGEEKDLGFRSLQNANSRLSSQLIEKEKRLYDLRDKLEKNDRVVCDARKDLYDVEQSCRNLEAKLAEAEKAIFDMSNAHADQWGTICELNAKLAEAEKSRGSNCELPPAKPQPNIDIVDALHKLGVLKECPDCHGTGKCDCGNCQSRHCAFCDNRGWLKV